MTSNLDELATNMYEDYDKARQRADACISVGTAAFQTPAVGFMQAATNSAQLIIALEQGKKPQRSQPQRLNHDKQPNQWVGM